MTWSGSWGFNVDVGLDGLLREAPFVQWIVKVGLPTQASGSSETLRLSRTRLGAMENLLELGGAYGTALMVP